MKKKIKILLGTLLPIGIAGIALAVALPLTLCKHEKKEHVIITTIEQIEEYLKNHVCIATKGHTYYVGKWTDSDVLFTKKNITTQIIINSLISNLFSNTTPYFNLIEFTITKDSLNFFVRDDENQAETTLNVDKEGDTFHVKQVQYSGGQLHEDQCFDYKIDWGNCLVVSRSPNRQSKGVLMFKSNERSSFRLYISINDWVNPLVDFAKE